MLVKEPFTAQRITYYLIPCTRSALAQILLSHGPVISEATTYHNRYDAANLWMIRIG